MTGIRTPGVERIQDPAALTPDEELDRSLRPKTLGDFVGQERVKEQLAIFIEAAKGRDEALDHVLLAGPPGLGKTSLAQIVANELGARFVATAGPALERKGDVASYLTALEPRSVFFVDEIHRLPRALEETFYPAMEDRQLPITVGQGAGARPWCRSTCPPSRSSAPPPARACSPRRCATASASLTASGSTSRQDLARIVQPLRRDPRRGHRQRRRRGHRRPLARHAARGQPPAQARARLRRGARHRPHRRARRRARRSTCSRSTRPGSTGSTARSSAPSASKFGGGPVGLSTLAVAVGEEQDTIEDVYEPYLLQQGFLMRTPRGRMATDSAFAHLGLEPPRGGGQRLF